MEFQNPILTVDAVLLALFDGELTVALMKRPFEPFVGYFALPGGYVHANEDADTTDAMARVLREKLKFTPRHLEQVFTASGPTRDPRGWSASVVYLALTEAKILCDLAEAGRASLFPAHVFDDLPTARLPHMAFDHERLVRMALERLRDKAGYTTIIGNFLPKKFPFADFHAAYQAVRGQTVNLPAFRKKVIDAGVLQEHKELLHGSGRPAAAFSMKAPLAYFDRNLGGRT